MDATICCNDLNYSSSHGPRFGGSGDSRLFSREREREKAAATLASLQRVLAITFYSTYTAQFLDELISNTGKYRQDYRQSDQHRPPASTLGERKYEYYSGNPSSARYAIAALLIMHFPGLVIIFYFQPEVAHKPFCSKSSLSIQLFQILRKNKDVNNEQNNECPEDQSI
ncbi:hypothetical protein ACTMU2_07235 [Cupriavidus basilensis]